MFLIERHLAAFIGPIRYIAIRPSNALHCHGGVICRSGRISSLAMLSLKLNWIVLIAGSAWCVAPFRWYVHLILSPSCCVLDRTLIKKTNHLTLSRQLSSIKFHQTHYTTPNTVIQSFWWFGSSRSLVKDCQYFFRRCSPERSYPNESWQVGPKISMSRKRLLHILLLYLEFRYCCVN